MSLLRRAAIGRAGTVSSTGPLGPSAPWPLLIHALSLLLLAGSLGCSQQSLFIDPPGELRLISVDQRLRGGGDTAATIRRFDRAIYRFEDENTLTILLFEGALATTPRIALVNMFWQPRAGATPIDPTATNAVVRYIAFRPSVGGTGVPPVPNQPITDDSSGLGVYGGAGFVRLHSNPTTGQLEATLRDADLRLTDRSRGFVDTLGRAVLAGSFRAQRNDALVTTMLGRLNRRVSEALGYPRLVRADFGTCRVDPADDFERGWEVTKIHKSPLISKPVLRLCEGPDLTRTNDPALRKASGPA